MTIGCKYLNDLFEIKLIFYGLRCMFSEFVWALSYSL